MSAVDTAKVGLSLRKARVVCGISRRQAGEDIGVTEKTIYSWETAKAMPPLDKAIALADVYGISVGELVGELERDKAWLIEKGEKLVR